MNVSSMKFDGHLLNRGFWLYVWRIKHGHGTAFYVGRTGDTSSPHASSPFRRIGQHLDARDNAKGNAMLRQLRAAHIDPTRCEFEMTAIGPVFPEEQEMTRHCTVRDQAAGLERAIADHLEGHHQTVLGTHPKRRTCDPILLADVLRIVDDRVLQTVPV